VSLKQLLHDLTERDIPEKGTCTYVTHGGGWLMIKTEEGAVRLFRPHQESDWGKNSSVYLGSFLDMFVTMGLASLSSTSAYHRKLDREQKAAYRKREIEELRELAARYGYTVSKGKKKSNAL
jgi:hypothetical protein